MWKNNVRMAIRHLLGSRATSLINVLGLGVGLAAVLLIGLYVRHEIRFERFFPDAGHIYKVEVAANLPDGGQHPGPTMPVFYKDILDEIGPPVEAASRLGYLEGIVRRPDGTAFYEILSYVDPEFFDIFRLDFIAGDAARPFPDIDALVLSESMARKYFGSTDVVGKTLRVDNKYDMHITGVYRDLPAETHLDPGILAPYDRERLSGWPLLAGHWGAQQFRTYMKLAPGARPADIASRVSELEKKYFPAFSMGGRDYAPGEFLDARFVPLRDVHFSSAEATGNRAMVIGFMAIAGAILVIAVINFVNLSIARATRYAREVSVRRVFGARRREIVFQFLGESVLTALLGAALALGVAAAVLPHLNALFGDALGADRIGWGPALLLFGLAVLAGLAGGLYPALLIARFRPGIVLRTNESEAPAVAWTRTILVVAQFATSIALIAVTLVVYRQTEFARHADLGYRDAGQIILRGLDRDEVRPKIGLLRERLMKVPGVVAAAASLNAPGEGIVNVDGARVATDSGGREINVLSLAADPEFLEVYGIRPLAGRVLRRDRALDDVNAVRRAGDGALGAFLITADGVRQLGFSSPQAILGRRMTLRGVDGVVVGVLPVLNFRSIRENPEPVVVYYESGFAQVMNLRVAARDLDRLLADIDAAWAEIFPDVPIQREFLQDRLATLYRTERMAATLLSGFATLAILLAVLGLYSLAAFAAARRTREIGVRKTFGARIRDILRLMLWQFTKPVVLANLVAWPVAWYAMRRWLDGFAYRIELAPWPFLAAGAAALLVALLTVSGHALAVARTHPAIALREE